MDNIEYDNGFVDALKTFAWWKDGIEYVGSCGMTLKEAIENRKTFIYYRPSIYDTDQK